jgi:hypothetical protein
VVYFNNGRLFMHKYLEELKKIAKSRGGDLISTEYYKATTKYTFIDEDNNIFEAAGYSIKSGKWSPHTAQKRKAKALFKYTIQNLKQIANSKGGDCLSTEFLGYKKKYKWIDSKQREFEMSFDAVLSGQWSPHEKVEKLSKYHTKYSVEYLSSFAKTRGGEFLSKEYTRLDARYEWRDRNNVYFTRTWVDILKTNDVLYNVGGSKPENELIDFFSDLNIPIIRNDRLLISPKELDLYIPTYKMAIEFNGLLWHSEYKGKDKNYHLDKMNQCNIKGVNLIQIFENEWKTRKPQVKSFLRSKFGKNEVTIFARKTEIREVGKDIAKQFLNEYHILGNCNHHQAYGLYLENELLALVTIGKHHRNAKEWILSRFVGKNNITVVGGLSKLTKHCVGIYGELATWVDLRWSNGQSWEKLGWEHVHTLPPDYFYFNPNKNSEIYSKQSRKKSVVRTPEGMTEWEHAQKDGLTRIWDCGKIKLIYRK